MKMMKEIIKQLLTGLNNKHGLYGSFPGNYQMAVLRLK